MSSPRRFAAVLLLPAVLALGSCGGGGEDENVGELLDKAFRSEIGSADLELDATVEIKGAPGLDRPIRLRASGPYRSKKGKLPEIDLDLKVDAGGGQTVETGFLSTGDRAFVKFQDVYYEQPREQVERTNRSLERGSRGRRGSLKTLGLDPRAWLIHAQDEGDEEVAGTDTRHVSGKLDVAKVVRDFNDLLRRPEAAALGGGAAAVPDPLSRDELEKVSEIVKDPSFDVYVGKDDDTVRRVAARLELAVPREDRDDVGGIEGGSLSFSIEFSDVGGDQRIEAPARARPLSDLTGSLGAAGQGSGSQSPQEEGSPETESFERYAECLDKAKPQDTAALQRCAELLR